MNWYFIKGAPQTMWALYKNEKTINDPAWSHDLLGWIERTKDGSWNCFALNWVGNEPNKKYAKEKILLNVFKIEDKP